MSKAHQKSPVYSKRGIFMSINDFIVVRKAVLSIREI